MAQLSRIIDKYKGKKFCDLPAESQEEYLGAIAQRGAMDALKLIGLDDENAAKDILALRTLMTDFKNARTIARSGAVAVFKQAWGMLIKVGVTMALVYIMVKMGVNTEKLKQIGDALDIVK